MAETIATLLISISTLHESISIKYNPTYLVHNLRLFSKPAYIVNTH